jgi:hypothetical protein
MAYPGLASFFQRVWLILERTQALQCPAAEVGLRLNDVGSIKKQLINAGNDLMPFKLAQFEMRMPAPQETCWRD